MKGPRGSRDPEREAPAERSGLGAAESILVEWLEREPDPTDADFERLCTKHARLRAELTPLWRNLRRYDAFRAEVLGPLRKPTRRAGPGRFGRGIAKAAGAAIVVGAALWFGPVQSGLETANACVAAIATIKGHVESALASVDPNEAELFVRSAEERRSGKARGTGESITYERWSASFAEAHGLLTLARSASEEVAGRTIVRPHDRDRARDLEIECARIVGGASDSEPAIGRALAVAAAAVAPSKLAGGFIHGRLAGDEGFRRLRSRLKDRDDVPQELCVVLDRVAGVASIEVRVFDLEADGRKFEKPLFFLQAASPTNVLGPPTRVEWPEGKGTLEPGDWRITVVDPEQERHSELRVLAFPGDQLVQVAFLRSTERVIAEMAHRPGVEIAYEPVEPPIESSDDKAQDFGEVCTVDELWVDPFEVTCEEWARFVADLWAHPEWFDGSPPVDWPEFADASGVVALEKRREAIASIHWDEAALYAVWAGKRLPTDREWMRIAAGPEQREYPWGSKFDPALVDVASAPLPQEDPTASKASFGVPEVDPTALLNVDAEPFVQGATPAEDGARIFRLADNVSEYTEDLDLRRAGNSVEFAAAVTYKRRSRGGNWFFNGPEYASVRYWAAWVPRPLEPLPFQGVRCVKTRLAGQFTESR